MVLKHLGQNHIWKSQIKGNRTRFYDQTLQFCCLPKLNLSKNPMKTFSIIFLNLLSCDQSHESNWMNPFQYTGVGLDT